MRLEIEPTVAAPHLQDETACERPGADSVESKSALNQGIKYAQAGNRAQARISLLTATEIDPQNENAWLWLASISEYPEELLGFLNHVLAINPENQRALEWKIATNALLSKTFVQRGVDASQENQKEFASGCFQKALEYDDRNGTAWMWMAALSDSNIVKVTMLEKALEMEPDNDSAAAALTQAKNNILKERLTEAKAAAVAGDNPEAVRILDTLLSTNPDSIDAWTMRSHLAEGFDEKIRCFESILAIDPTNVAAKSGRDSLLLIFGTAEAANSETADSVQVEPIDEVRRVDDVPAFITEAFEPAIDKNPTQDLEIMPEFPAEQYDPVFETQAENKNEDETMECREEPFGSLAEEAPESSATVCEPEHLTVEETFVDSPFAPHEQDFAEVYTGPQAETVAFSYTPETSADQNSDWSDETVSSPLSDPEIPMPDYSLPVIEATNDSGSQEQTVFENGELLVAKPESADCPFCGNANEPQAISCQACLAVLTLSDLELLLANQNADKSILRQAVEVMERKRASRALETDELVTLGLGHLNLRNLQLGYSCLVEASKLDTNNVVLTGQVNSLLIRLEEIKLQEEAHLKMPKGKSILVVDDSATVRKLIAGKLEKCGHDVICANDGVEAMERLEHFVPDLVLLDIAMPRMDGYQVCKTIRGNHSTKDVPVVMISGKDGFFDKVRGRMAGTTGYITKPFGPETLMKAVEMYLSGEIPQSDEHDGPTW